MAREITSVSGEGSDYYRSKDLTSNSERPLLACTAAIRMYRLRSHDHNALPPKASSRTIMLIRLFLSLCIATQAVPAQCAQNDGRPGRAADRSRTPVAGAKELSGHSPSE